MYSGTILETSAVADSRSVPEGSPVAGSRSMRPFGGSGVSRVTPAIASAFEFAHAEWPSAAQISAGRSGTTRSSASLCGFAFGKTKSCQPVPRTHGRVGFFAAQSRTASSTCCSVVSSESWQSPSSTPLDTGCTCVS